MSLLGYFYRFMIRLILESQNGSLFAEIEPHSLAEVVDFFPFAVEVLGLGESCAVVHEQEFCQFSFELAHH